MEVLWEYRDEETCHCAQSIFFMVFCSYALFDMEGKKVPQTLVTQVGGVFESLLEEVRFVICACVMLICCKTSYCVGWKEYVGCIRTYHGSTYYLM